MPLPTVPVSVAGQEVADPLGVLRGYLQRHGKTLRAYDLAGLGNPDILSFGEVVRTRVMASRISHREAAWFVERAALAPWSAVPEHARLADADPMVAGGAYDDALALYDHFAAATPVRVRGGKLHKVLHLKRPHLYPILDSQLRRTYRTKARMAGAQLTRNGRPSGRAYWAAIREDLLANARALCQLRDQLVEDSELRALAGLSELRLLDILAWSLTAPMEGDADAGHG
jgi:Family of unknown function (DUF6308)